jgi:uncharacterized protein
MSTNYSYDYPASSEDRFAAVAAHASALVAMVISVGWLSFVGPLLVWMVTKDRPYAHRAAAGAFNFNLAISALSILGWLLVITVLLAPLGGIMIGLATLIQLWCHIHASLRASRGRSYRYPFQLHILPV